MTKTYTTEQLRSMSLKELAAATGIASLVKCSKAKAIERARAVLPAPKAEAASKGETKTARLFAALKDHRRTLDELLELTGFDARNLGVTISIQRARGADIRYDRAGGFYTMH